MRKEIYLIRGNADESYKQFSKRIVLLENTASEDKNIIQINNKSIQTDGLGSWLIKRLRKPGYFGDHGRMRKFTYT